MTTYDETKYFQKLTVCKLTIEEYKKREFYEKYKEAINYWFFRKGFIHTSINYLLNAKKCNLEVIAYIYEELQKNDSNYRMNRYYKSKKIFCIIDRILCAGQNF